MRKYHALKPSSNKTQKTPCAAREIHNNSTAATQRTETNCRIEERVARREHGHRNGKVHDQRDERDQPRDLRAKDESAAELDGTRTAQRQKTNRTTNSLLLPINSKATLSPTARFIFKLAAFGELVFLSAIANSLHVGQHRRRCQWMAY